MRFPGRSKTPVARTADDHMTLIEHLAELRMRLIRSVLGVLIGFTVVMAFYNRLLGFLQGPYERICKEDLTLNCENNGLYILSPMEGFSTRISVSVYAGVILALPIILWQIWRFIVPGLHKKEKQYAVPFVASSVLLFLLGGAIAFWTLDKALQFLISYSGDNVGQVFQISKYISFVGLMVAAFGVGMEFPVLLVFLQLVGVLSYSTLFKSWRYAIVGIVAIAALITPSGDPISLAALSVPMLVLYFVAALIGMLIQKRRAKASAGT